MSRPLRYQPGEWSTVFVTGRCIHSRFLLTPSPRVNALINGIVERGCTRYAVRLHAMCFMSNHYHLLFSSQDAASTSSFMQFILSNIAREIGRLRNWREKFWGRRYPNRCHTNFYRNTVSDRPIGTKRNRPWSQSCHALSVTSLVNGPQSL